MNQLDLHGMKTTEALQALTSRYNRLVGSSGKELVVVHGYGSKGIGGDLKRRVRKFLRSAGVSFLTEEDNLHCNRGQTLVQVGKSLLSLGSELETKILDFCSPAKTKKKIFSKFHKSGEDAVRQAFSALTRNGQLQEKQKGKFKVYEGRG